MTILQRLASLRRNLPVVLEVVRWIVDETQDLREAQQRLARKAREGDLDDSLARLRALTESDD